MNQTNKLYNFLDQTTKTAIDSIFKKSASYSNSEGDLS